MFQDPANFPFVGPLEARWQDIRQEFQNLSAEDLIQWPELDLYEGGWDVFGLVAFGKRLEQNCLKAPRSAALVEAIPGLVTAGFSKLAPGTRLRPHVGYSSAVLRCHLGLIVPPDCALQVGDEVRSWQPGKCLVFDDTTLHSAWNNSQSPRIVLLLDVLRAGERFDAALPPEVEQAIRREEQSDG